MRLLFQFVCDVRTECEGEVENLVPQFHRIYVPENVFFTGDVKFFRPHIPEVQLVFQWP